MLWKWVSAALGDEVDQQGTNAPHKPHNSRAGAKKDIRGELNRKMVLDAIREKKRPGEGSMVRWQVGHRRVSRVLETEHGLQKTEKEREVMVGPGPREFQAGYEKISFGELRVR